MFIKKVILTAIVTYLSLISISFGLTVTKKDNFDSSAATFFETFSKAKIEQDDILDEVVKSKSCSFYLISNSDAILIMKNLNLHTESQIIQRCPLGEHVGVLRTGKAHNRLVDTKLWNSFAGLVYTFDALFSKISLSFSYLNTRDLATGKVIIILQEVDAQDNVRWEKVFPCDDPKLLYKNKWVTTNFAGSIDHKFNRVWLLETGLDRKGWAYFDDVEVTVFSNTP